MKHCGSAVVAILLACVFAQAGEPGGGIEDKALARPLHLPPLTRLNQLREFTRQLEAPVILDLGREEDSQKDVPEFHFEKGTIRQALDAYCKERPYCWRPLEKEGLLVIEPKDARMRMIDMFLKRAFRTAPAIEKMPRQPLPMLYFSTVSDRWDETRWPGAEARLAFSLDCEEKDQLGIPWDEQKKVPANVYEFMLNWLREGGRFAVIEKANFNAEDDQGRIVPVSEIRADLKKIDTETPAMSDGALVERFLAPHAPLSMERFICCDMREVYRRLCADKKQMWAAMTEKKFLEKISLGKASYALALLSFESPEGFGQYLVAQFNGGDASVQKKILDSHALTVSGPVFENFWKSLLKSKNAEHAAMAERHFKSP